MNKKYLLALTGMASLAIGIFGFSQAADAQSCGWRGWGNNAVQRQERIEHRRWEEMRAMERANAGYYNNGIGHFIRPF